MRTLSLLWLLFFGHYADAQTTNVSVTEQAPTYLTTLDPYAAPQPAQTQQLLLLSNALKQEFGQFEIPAKLTINDALLQRNFLKPFNPASNNFSEAAVMQGAWLPMNFVRDIGYGLYIDEPLVADKPLLVLVHGMTDSPLRWQALLKKLNYESYQVLRFHYPTGMPLDTDAQVLAKMLERVIARTPNQRMIIIAHSMGGLVSRRAIQHLATDKKTATVDYFFSVATPWGGHQLAALGAAQSPIVVPVWRDLAMNSTFLKQLYAQRLPTAINFDLFYATAGGRAIFNEPNDGVVTVKSQLDERAKQEAKNIVAINSAHVAALLHADALKAFNAALFSTAIKDEL
jgi:pimeloyl-ACP methyl ester carboxylesterase